MRKNLQMEERGGREAEREGGRRGGERRGEVKGDHALRYRCA